MLLELLTFLGLVLFLEGVLLALFPEALRRMMLAFAARPAPWLRRHGLIIAILAAGFLYGLSVMASGDGDALAFSRLRQAFADLL